MHWLPNHDTLEAIVFLAELLVFAWRMRERREVW